VQDLPVPVAFDVYCRDGEDMTKVGSFTSGNGDIGGGYWTNYPGQQFMRSVSGGVNGLRGNQIDLVMKPRPDLALRTVDLTRVYDGEVVIKGVSLQKMPGMSSVTTVTQTTDAQSDEKSKDAGDETKAKPRKKGSGILRWLGF